MAILNVPIQYPSIQSAIDAAQYDDVIVIRTGIYEESLEIMQKNTIKIRGSGLVILDGTDIESIGISIEGNNISLSNIQLVNYTYGISVKGNNNCFSQISCDQIEKDAFVIEGNRNNLITCKVAQCKDSGIALSGCHNLVLGCQFAKSHYGVLMESEQCVSNVVDRNTFVNIKTAAIAMTSPCCDKNMLLYNTINESQKGIISVMGRHAVIGNDISGCCTEALQMTTEESLIVFNTLINNNIGMKLNACCSIIAENTIQAGNFTGLSLSGNCNYILKNIIYGYREIGLLVNGINNHFEANTIRNNGTDVLDDSICNTYCQVNNGCTLTIEASNIDYCSDYSRAYDKIQDLLDSPEEVLDQYGIKVDRRNKHKNN